MDYAPLSLGPERAVVEALSGRARGIAVPTSGSTGHAREVLIGADAVRASALATHAALGGVGTWLLALPEQRIAGAMVIARSHMAGTTPTRMPAGSFTAEAFARAADAMSDDSRRYTSLVPTQLARIVDSAAGRDALMTFDAVLVGGAPALRPISAVNSVESYGATETTSGCVYDGWALEGVTVRVIDGLIRVAGPILADGYADGDDSAFVRDDGERWFVTSDLGGFGADGRLDTYGRADDVIISGGVNVYPARVEAVLAQLDWVDEAVVVGVPDPDWGQRVVAVIAAREGHTPPEWATVRTELSPVLDAASLPRAATFVDALPRLLSSKIDRSEARRIAHAAHADRKDLP